MRKLLHTEVLHAKNINKVKQGFAKTKKEKPTTALKTRDFGACLYFFELASCNLRWTIV